MVICKDDSRVELQFHCPEIHDKHWRPMPVMRQVLNGHQRLGRIRKMRFKEWRHLSLLLLSRKPSENVPWPQRSTPNGCLNRRWSCIGAVCKRSNPFGIPRRGSSNTTTMVTRSSSSMRPPRTEPWRSLESTRKLVVLRIGSKSAMAGSALSSG